MKKLFVVPALLLLLTTLFTGCDSSRSLSVKKFTPSEGIKPLTTLQFEFSKDVAPPEILNEWSDEEYVQFTPKVFGKFKWVNRRTLIFSPDVPYEELKDYKVTITQKVLFASGLNADFSDLHFRTEDFTPLAMTAYWKSSPQDSRVVFAMAKMSFNYPVSPAEIKKQCVFTVEGKPVQNFEIVDADAGQDVLVNLGEIKERTASLDVTATLKEGLTPTAGRGGLAKEKELNAELPDITTLKIFGVSSGYDGNTAWLEAYTSQRVDDKQLKQFISLPGLTGELHFTVNDESVRIETELSGYSQVTLAVKKGLAGALGGVLREDFVEPVSLVALSPAINFADRTGKYLLLKGERNLRINAVNIEQAEVEVQSIPANKMLSFLNNYTYEYGSGENYDYNRYYYPGNYAKIVHRDTVELEGYKNWLQTSTINLNSLVPAEKKGIYVVTVLSSKDRYISDSKIIALSDIGLIVKQSDNGVTVFVNDLKTAEPLSGVTVKVMNEAGEVLMQGVSTAEGIAKFILKEPIPADDPAVLVTAETGTDFNYIDLREARVETSRYDVDGKTFEDKDLMTYLYMDRNLYRPSDRVYFSAIVRDREMKQVKDMPLYFKVYAPSGKLIEDLVAHLSPEGSCENSFVLAPAAQVGTYTIAAYSSPEHQITSQQFSVEEFTPEKMRVMVQTDKQSAKQNESVIVNISAEYLFGASANGSKYQAITQYREMAFASAAYPDYDFGTVNKKQNNPEQKVDGGTLNEQGKGSYTLTMPVAQATSGYFLGATVVSVFDQAGKAVVRSQQFNYYPNSVYLGVKSGDYYIATNQRKQFSLLAVSPESKPVAGTVVEYEINRSDWTTTLKKNYDGRYSYSSVEKITQIEKHEVTLGAGAQTFSFIPQKWGKYELVLRKKGTVAEVRKTFYAYGGTGIASSTFEVNKEGEVTILPSKTNYKTGEQAKLLFTTPFNGKMLVTAEAEGLLFHKYITVTNNAAELSLPILQAYVPNIYITATLFKPHNAKDNTPLFVAHGYSSLKVDDQSDKIPVTIVAPERVKPGTTQNITVNTGSSAYVTLALVDEGVLQIKDFQSPDPYTFYYAKRALGTAGFDMYKLLLPEFALNNKTPGADAFLAKSMRNRLNPVSAKRYNIFSFWSGIVQSRGGTVTIPVKIPQFNGEARIMAVAYSGRKFGAASKPMKVSDDVVVEQQLPRVLSSGDSVASVVTLVNTTGKQVSVNLSVKAEGEVKMLQYPQQGVTLKAGEMKSLTMSYLAGSPGIAKFTATVSGNANSKETVEISVRPANPWSAETGSGTIKAGSQVQIKVPGGFYGSPQSSIVISKFPAAMYLKELRALMTYPYGCLEQITAKAFPQLYIGDIIKAAFPNEKEVKGGAAQVKDAIKRIEAQQLYNGSFSYWEGDTYSNWWGTVFAVHFLIEAQKAGFSVNGSVLSSALGFLQRKVKEPFTTQVIAANNKTKSVSVPREVPYTLYVLSIAKRPDYSSMNYCKAFTATMSADDIFLLAGAYAAAGKWKTYYELTPKSFAPEKRGRTGGYSFDSGLRGDLIKLNILLDQEPGNAQIPALLRYAASNRTNCVTTQEQAFLFTALGKVASRYANSKVTVEVKDGNTSLGKFSGNTLTINKNNLSGKTVTLSASGDGEVFYHYATEGLKVNGTVKEEDSFLKVRREYYDFVTGRKITDNVFNRGQLIVGIVSIGAGDAGAENVAISDMLPGCLEAENTRLSAMGNLQWMNNKPMEASSTQFRDDRIIFFTSLNKNETKQFYYFARVTANGKFTLPPAAAECMYMPEIHSYNGKGTVKSR